MIGEQSIMFENPHETLAPLWNQSFPDFNPIRVNNITVKTFKLGKHGFDWKFILTSTSKTKNVSTILHTDGTRAMIFSIQNIGS